MRIGVGYDRHPLQEGRTFRLGGVAVPCDKGLAGHSDADALAHAVADALLGAAGLEDLGTLFPSSDPRFKDADSLKLLAQAVQKIRGQGLKPEQVDSVVVCQEPKLSPYLSAMRSNLAEVLELPVERVNVKVKSGEKLGWEGEGRGVGAFAVCLLNEVSTEVVS